MTRLHITRKSADHVSMGPSGVEAQSTVLANLTWPGPIDSGGSRVQSKTFCSTGAKEISPRDIGFDKVSRAGERWPSNILPLNLKELDRIGLGGSLVLMIPSRP